MKTKLIKIKNDYIIVDDSGIKSGDYRVLIDKSSNLYGQFEKHLGGYECNDQWMKITHSTKPLEDVVIYNKYEGKGWVNVKPLPLSEIKELLFGYDVEKMAESKWTEFDLLTKSLQPTEWDVHFINGKLTLKQ